MLVVCTPQIDQSGQTVEMVLLGMGHCSDHQGMKCMVKFHTVLDYVHQTQSCCLLVEHEQTQGMFGYP